MVPVQWPAPPPKVSALTKEEQAKVLGSLYSEAINGWGRCEKYRAALIDWIMGD